eukprot:1753820-Rhodomonas_salina.2
MRNLVAGGAFLVPKEGENSHKLECVSGLKFAPDCFPGDRTIHPFKQAKTCTWVGTYKHFVPVRGGSPDLHDRTIPFFIT